MANLKIGEKDLLQSDDSKRCPSQLGLGALNQKVNKIFNQTDAYRVHRDKKDRHATYGNETFGADRNDSSGTNGNIIYLFSPSLTYLGYILNKPCFKVTNRDSIKNCVII